MPRWLILCILTVVFFGGWTVTPKAPEVSSFSSFQQQALSTLGILPVLAFLALSRKARGGTAPTRGSALAFFSGLLTASGNIAYYQALKDDNPTTTVVPLTMLYPVVTVVLAMIFLREKPNVIQIVGIGLALAAIYVLNPLGSEAKLASFRALLILPIAFWGAAGIFQKLATRHVSGERATLWFLLAFVPLAAGILIHDRGVQGSLSAQGWFLMALVGLLFGVGNLTLLSAFAAGGKASVVAPISGLYSIVSVPLAMLLFHEQVTRTGWIGVGLSLMAVIALSIERQAEAGPAAAPPVQSPP